MHRHVIITSTVGFLVAQGTIGFVSAQQPAPATQGAPARDAAAPGPREPRRCRWSWTSTSCGPPARPGQTKVVQDNIGDPNLELKQYGLHESCLLTSGNPGSETTPFSVWSGECERPVRDAVPPQDELRRSHGRGQDPLGGQDVGVPRRPAGREACRRHHAGGRNGCRVGADAAPERGAARRHPLDQAGSEARRHDGLPERARSMKSGCRTSISAASTKWASSISCRPAAMAPAAISISASSRSTAARSRGPPTTSSQ